VLTERIDHLVVRGTSITLPIMGVFDVQDGLIAEWRDYFDLASYRAQLPTRGADEAGA
jgi:limonene-1,2-epoxide hydrolase